MDASALDLTSALPQDPTVVRVLTRAFEEIRWNHPRVRVCGGVFVTPSTLRIMASVHPPTMTPLTGTCVVGDAVGRYHHALTAAGDLLESSDVPHDGRLAEIPASILGDDTRATLTIPLTDGEEIIGFIRMDGRDAEFLSPRAIEDLLTAADPGLVAAKLEPEIARLRRDAREDDRLLQWLGEHVERQRNALEALKSEIVGTAKKLDAIGKTLEPSTHRSLRSLCESVMDALDTANSNLEAHLDDAPRRDVAKVARAVSPTQGSVEAGTRRESVPSIGGTRG